MIPLLSHMRYMSCSVLFALWFLFIIVVSIIGNVYIDDSSNDCIRKVTVSTGIITTIAGTGSTGFSGDGGAAISATLNSPYSVTVDSSGMITIALCACSDRFIVIISMFQYRQRVYR